MTNEKTKNILDMNDINEIMKENLKIVNQVKSIKSMFLNERFTRKINYEPYFQRKYVWDREKATYFIESIILGTEIPPIVLFQTKNLNEVIDGRQRYETLSRFMNDRIVLNDKGLRVLTSLSGKKYSQLSPQIRESIENTKIRILQCSVVNEPNLSEVKEDKIKKEIFRRYNSGISPLKKPEIDRAEYIDDELTKLLKKRLEENKLLFEDVCSFFLPVSNQKSSDRDKINVLLSKIRTNIVLPKIPIENYASKSNKATTIQICYYYFFDKKDTEGFVQDFTEIIENLKKIRKNIEMDKDFHFSNQYLYDTCFWGISILKENKIPITDEVLFELSNVLLAAESKDYLWKGVDNDSRSMDSLYGGENTYFRQSVINRYLLMKNYLEYEFNLDLKKSMKDSITLNNILNSQSGQNIQFDKYKLHKPDPSSITIYDILDDMKENKFLIRPEYQRSETSNATIASYLLESVFLDIKIPPLFIYKREDKVKEVVDGQQRLLTFLGFLGEHYLDENGEKDYSKKNKFKLTKLTILKELNGKNIDTIDEFYKDKILDFPLDIVEIDASQNRTFDNIDLFLRLNTKPYPIARNSFEMWNAYVEKELTEKIKELAKEYTKIILRETNNRMKNEELITSLAFIDYMTNYKGEDISSILSIYVRNNKVCSRIKRKDKITEFLKTVSIEGDELFRQSIDNVRIFLEKISLLIDEEESIFASLFTKKSVKAGKFKSDQNFYFLWLMLFDVSKEQIISDKENIVEKIYKENEKLIGYYKTDIDNIEKFIENIKIVDN